MKSRRVVDVNPFKGVNGAYLLGYFTGDGGIRKKFIRVDGSSTFEVYITSKDRDLLEEMLLEYEGDAHIHTIHNGNLDYAYSRLSTFNRNVSDYLLSLGFKQKDKRGSDIFNSLTNLDKWKFVRGLFDSDGSVVQSGYLRLDGKVSISSVAYVMCYEELAFTLKDWFSRVGIEVNETVKGTKAGYQLYRLQVKGRYTEKFYEGLYFDDGLCLSRKKKLLGLDKKVISLEESLGLNVKNMNSSVVRGSVIVEGVSGDEGQKVCEQISGNIEG